MSQASRSQPAERILIAGLGALTFYAVLAYGLTTPETRGRFDLLLGGAFLLWIGTMASSKRLPAVSWPWWTLGGLLLAFGWISVLNAQFRHDWESGFLSVEGSWGISWLPSSADYDVSLSEMIHLTAMLGGFFVLIDLCRSRLNRRWLQSILVFAGFTIAIIGILQKASGAESVLFHDGVLTERRFFASYRYHGNAATLLNFCWPIAFAFFLRAFLKRVGPAEIALWSICFLFTFAAIFVNTSKMGQVLGLGLLFSLASAYRQPIRRLTKGQSKPWLGIICSFLLLAGIVGLMISLSFDTSVDRWADLRTSAEARWRTYATCLSILPASGWTGLGPGSFSSLFPYFAEAQGRELEFFYETAHQDYLQCVIEWGFIGSMIWLGFACIVIMRSWVAVRGSSFYGWALSLALAAAAIQAFVDFPAQIASLQWLGLILISTIIGIAEDSVS